MRNMVFHNLRIVGLGVAVLALAACAGEAMKGYTGPVLPADQTALVTRGPYTDLVACDGTKVSGVGVTLLPGVHTIEMKPNNQQQNYTVLFHSTVIGSVSFTAEAGHRYLAYVSISPAPPTDEEAGSGYTWTGIIEDKATHRKVARTDKLPLFVEPVPAGQIM